MHTAVHLVEDWKTDDGGQTWDSMGKDTISSSDVVSVSVSILEAGNGKKGFNTAPLHHGAFLQDLGLLMSAGLNQIKPSLVMFMLL